MLTLPPIPDAVKHIAHFLKVADDHDERNIVVSYWSRMWACQVALKSVSGPKPPEITALVIAIMDWLERTKKENADLDGITNDTAAQALIEEYALQLFNYADAQDIAQSYGKNVVKAYYTCGILMDVMTQFGQLSEDFYAKRRYAKWKAAYIHNCLKRGEKPNPDLPKDRFVDSEDDDNETNRDFKKVRAARYGPPPYLPTGDILPSEPYEIEEIEPKKPSQTFITPPEDSMTPPEDSITPPEDSITPPQTPEEPIYPQRVQPAPVQPAPQPIVPQPSTPVIPSSSKAGVVSQEGIKQAQKFCKYASSALDYDDINTAIDNLQRALSLLQGSNGNSS